MLKFLVLLTAAPGLLAENSAFVCPTDKELTNFLSTTVTADSCCKNYVHVPTCQEPTAGGAPFACKQNHWVATSEILISPPNETSCCTLIKTTCAAATGHSTGTTAPHPCAKKKPDSEEKSPTDEACCETFAPTCLHQTNVAEDPYPCPINQTFNYDNYDTSTPATATEDVKKAACCKELVRTCEYYSGTDAKQVGYVCPPGEVAREVLDSDKDKVPSASICCKKFVASCGQTIANGGQQVCGTGKVEITPMSTWASTLVPSIDKCCKAPTCSDAVQTTCGSMKTAGSTCASPKVVDTTKSANLAKNSPASQYTSMCCKDAVKFSEGHMLGASSLGVALLSSLLLL